MEIVCLDMEGTLTEEIWEKVAHDTGIEDLGKTTRDIPSYEDLLDMRIEIMSKEGIGLSDCLLYTSPSPRDVSSSRMPSSA